ncbi:MAG TPA: Do family serine endopeptidase [Caulobacteraceae bacterium]|jgi:serine protease Do|nr:Do family serine endopeptidase [Caulobacteraceae bacterium]
MKTNFVSGAALGAIATMLVGGGYLAGAHAQLPGQSAAPHLAAVAPMSFADIVQKVAPAVVSIDVQGKAGPSRVVFGGPGGIPFGFSAPDGDGGDQDDNGAEQMFRRLIPQAPQVLPPQHTQATGSGFFISADGYIVTNNHVVDGAETITVRTADGRSLKAHLVGRDQATDLAVVKVDGGGFPFVDFENSAKPRVGDWVVAVGNPFNLSGTATAGIVSALGRSNVSGSSYVDYMQIDAPINRGNSGGPTFDVEGRVVGVNSAIFSPSGGSVGIGFDIPADVAAQITRQLIADGKVTRGYLGAQVQDVTPEIADSLGIPGRKGALVAELTPGGPSERAGLQQGDVILKIDGADVASAADLTRRVALAHAGENVQLEIRRDGRVREVDVRSGVRPTEASLNRNPEPEQGDSDTAADARKVLGMQLEPKAGGGVAIASVAGDSDAGEKGLHQGDVILRAGETRTNAPADVEAAVSAAKREGRSSVLLMVARGGGTIFVPLKVAPAAG